MLSEVGAKRAPPVGGKLCFSAWRDGAQYNKNHHFERKTARAKMEAMTTKFAHHAFVNFPQVFPSEMPQRHLRTQSASHKSIESSASPHGGTSGSSGGPHGGPKGDPSGKNVATPAEQSSKDDWSEEDWWQQHAWTKNAGSNASPPSSNYQQSKSKGSHSWQPSIHRTGWHQQCYRDPP